MSENKFCFFILQKIKYLLCHSKFTHSKLKKYLFNDLNRKIT